MNIVVEQDRLDALCRLRQTDPRMPAPAQAIRERLFSEATQYREKTNVVDHADDRIAFIADGIVRRDVAKKLPWTSRALRSLQRLRDALRSLGRDRWPVSLVEAVRALGSAREMQVSNEIAARISRHLDRNKTDHSQRRSQGIER